MSNMHTLLSGGSATLALLLIASTAVAADAAPLLAGTWTPTKSAGDSVRTVDGKAPPLTVAGRAVQAQRKSKTGTDPVKACLPPGTPRILLQDGPLLLLQTASKVTFVHEFQHILRHVYLNEALAAVDELDSLYGGTAAGKWDGDTLVVETAGFGDNLWLDRSGLPQSANARITERLRLTEANALEDLVTVNDPQNYSTPWTMRITFTRTDSTDLKEIICAETIMDPALRKSFQEKR